MQRESPGKAQPLDPGEEHLVPCLHRKLGMVVYYDPAIMTEEVKYWLDRGGYETQEAITAAATIDGNDRVLELGGGLGVVATYVARECRPAAYESVEAHPGLIAGFRKTLKENGVENVTVRHGILTASPALLAAGTARLFLHRDFWEGTTCQDYAAGSVTVPALSCDRIIQALQPNVLVCDIEGGELEFVRQVDLSRFSKLVMEVHPGVIGADGASEVESRVRESGFSLQKLFDDSLLVAARS